MLFLAEAIAEVMRCRWPHSGRALAYVGLAERESGDVVYAGGEKQCFSFPAR